MNEQLVAYFAAEKRGAWVLLAVGTVALVTAIALLASRSSYRGMAAPLGLLAVFELIIAVVLIARTNAQVAALLEQLAAAPADMARAELARMGPIMRNFTIVKIVELVVLAVGAVVAWTARGDVAFSVGVGCVAQAGLLLVFDLFAARRAEVYVDALRALVP